MTGFINLHVHDHFSLLDGATTPEKNAKRAAELGQAALAQTNHGTLTGSYEHYKQCRPHGIKPIIGIEAYVAPESRHTKTPVYWGRPDQRKEDVGDRGAATHMLLFARNATGLRNLYRLHHLSYTEGFYYKPRIDLDLLEQYKEGLIATTGCAGGAVPTMLRLGQVREAETYLGIMREIFQDNLFVEVMHHGLEFDDDLNSQLIEMSDWSGVPLLATADSHYTYPSESEAHDALLCVQTQALLSDENRFRFNGSGYHLMSAEGMHALPLPTVSIENTLLLADSISEDAYDEVFAKRDLMPRWGHDPMPDWVGQTPLRKLAVQARYDKFDSTKGEIDERLEHELSVIEEMGFSNYFLVLHDIISWARSRDILIGPARGSAGGSLVAFLLGITEIDPLRHELIFERFLNPSRTSPPDIDVDIQSDRRAEVFDYIVEKYGKDYVAHPITFGTIKAKAALKDANRVLGGEYKAGEALVQLVPPDSRGRSHPLSGLQKVQKANPGVYDLALGLEGLVRNTSMHAAGIIISPEPLPDIIPVLTGVKSEDEGEKDDMLVTAYPNEQLEELGLMKLDLLALKELAVMAKCLEFIDEVV